MVCSRGSCAAACITHKPIKIKTIKSRLAISLVLYLMFNSGFLRVSSLFDCKINHFFRYIRFSSTLFSRTRFFAFFRRPSPHPHQCLNVHHFFLFITSQYTGPLIYSNAIKFSTSPSGTQVILKYRLSFIQWWVGYSEMGSSEYI